MDKEELEKQISLLQERVEANKVMNQGYESDLLKAKQDLEDLNKPELTPSQLDAIHEAIEKAVEGFDFSSTDNYEVEFGIDYDGKVHLENVDLQAAYELTDNIVNKVCNLFKEVPSNEEGEADNS